MYMDKLDGRIDNDFFDRKAAEFRAALARLSRTGSNTAKLLGQMK